MIRTHSGAGKSGSRSAGMMRSFRPFSRQRVSKQAKIPASRDFSSARLEVPRYKGIAGSGPSGAVSLPATTAAIRGGESHAAFAAGRSARPAGRQTLCATRSDFQSGTGSWAHSAQLSPTGKGEAPPAAGGFLSTASGRGSRDRRRSRRSRP